MKKRKVRLRKRTTISMYHALSDEKRKKWMSERDIYKAYDKCFHGEDGLTKLDADPAIQKNEFVFYTEEYMYFLKYKTVDDEFTGVKHRIIKMYNRADVEEYVEKQPIEPYGVRAIVRNTHLKINDDLRTRLNDHRSLKHSEVLRTKFYGRLSDTVVDISKGDEFRMYYAMFLNYSYISKLTNEGFGLRQGWVQLFLFLHVYKYFTYLDLHNYPVIDSLFFRKPKNKSDEINSVKAVQRWLLKEGYIEVVEYKAKSMHKKRYRRKALVLHTTTEKLDNIVKQYSDYLLYKRKMPYLGKGKNFGSPTLHDMYGKDDKLYSEKSVNAYNFYEYVYDWVNFNADVRYFDGEMYEFLYKMNGSDIKYNPFLYRISEREFYKGNIDGNNKFIDTFLQNRRWGTDV